MDYLIIRKANQNNLKSINLKIPRRKWTVITGVSGSGKSSLAFDTIYAEGERRYLSTLSLYARQFLKQLEKADVETIKGLSPTISVEQKTIAPNPRSTVGSVSEVYDYLRLLFARVGDMYCPVCGDKIKKISVPELIERIFERYKGKKVRILSPAVIGRKGEFRALFEEYGKKGWTRVKIDGKWDEIDREIKLEKNKEHSISILIDSVKVENNRKERLKDGIRKAAEISKNSVIIEIEGKEYLYSTEYFCPKCGLSFKEFEPRNFSYNSPYGYCKRCKGLGVIIEDSRNGIEEKEICPVCNGKRLNKDVLNVRIKDKDISYFGLISIKKLLKELSEINFEGRKKKIADKILDELIERLIILQELSLGYLSLFRPVYSLSGGEAQRIRLASQLSSKLKGIIYVLDEPSIGLHPVDHKKLLKVLKRIKDYGNTIIVVEHDEDTINNADYIVDLGPGGGENGGKLLFSGEYKEFLKANTLTAEYLRKEKVPYVKDKRKKPTNWIKIKKAYMHNLKNIDIEIPLGILTVITGVSGSGKSTLLFDILKKGIEMKKRGKLKEGRGFADISGIENVSRIIEVNQSPIGKNVRSTPATYSGIFDEIRKLYAMLPESRAKGFNSAFFSYNVSKGKCYKCEGKGIIKVELGLLPPVYLRCEECGGKRYGEEVLKIKFKGKNIAEVLDMTVEEGLQHFKNIPAIRDKLRFLKEIGMDYIKLGQPTPNLSGGEAQRIKLAKELGRGVKKNTLYLLDEPTVGLHFNDIKKLIKSLRKFTERGDSIIIIEHNPDIIYSADYVIDLGPEGGEDGGYIIAKGKPEQIMDSENSKTGKILKRMFGKKKE